MEGKELSLCLSWWNSLRKGWSCGLVHCPGGNVTDLIWIVLASSDGISFWTPLKPQHSNTNPNPNRLANQLWCIDFLTPSTPLITPHRLPAFLESLMPLKNSCSVHARCSKSSLKHSIRFCGFFPSLKHNFIAYFNWNFQCLYKKSGNLLKAPRISQIVLDFCFMLTYLQRVVCFYVFRGS